MDRDAEVGGPRECERTRADHRGRDVTIVMFDDLGSVRERVDAEAIGVDEQCGEQPREDARPSGRAEPGAPRRSSGRRRRGHAQRLPRAAREFFVGHCANVGGMDHLDGGTRLVLSALLYACAYLAGLALFAMMARRRNIATAGIWILMQAGLIGGLAAAGLVQALASGAPGKTLLGGVAGGYLTVVLAKRVLGIARPTGDLWAVALAGGEAIGRLGCFVGGCCFGKAATVAWAVHDHGAARHPTQLYLAAAAFVTLCVLLLLDRYRLPENTLLYVQGSLLCALRFGIEFYRDGGPVAGGMTLAQWACLAGVTFFAWQLVRTLAPRVRGTRLRLATVRA